MRNLQSHCRSLHLSPGTFRCSETLAPLAGQALNPGTGGTGHVNSHLTHSGQLSQHQAVICCLILTVLKHHNFPFSALPPYPPLLSKPREKLQSKPETLLNSAPKSSAPKQKQVSDWSPRVVEHRQIRRRNLELELQFPHQVRGGSRPDDPKG